MELEPPLPLTDERAVLDLLPPHLPTAFPYPRRCGAVSLTRPDRLPASPGDQRGYAREPIGG